jgi:phytoene dehydrogenase-like protein
VTVDVDVHCDSGGSADISGSTDASGAAELAKAVARRLGVPGDGLTVGDVLTPADRERMTATPGGSLHGPAVDSLGSAILRSPTVQPIKGLLHIGASARPGPGPAFAALGAWNAAEVLKPTRV